MSRGDVLSISYFIVALFAIFTFMRVNDIFTLNTIDSYNVTYMPNVTGVSVYEITSSNTMKCNLTTINTIIFNMIDEDYFFIEQDFSNERMMDVVLSNGTEKYRILYNRSTRDYMCVSVPFLKNYVPTTYIHR